MIALIQRVLQAKVRVGEETVGAIGPGLLALLAVQPMDAEANARRIVERILAYRVFGDDSGRMNRALCDTGGGLLLVSQFTLAADTRKGNRASFTSAAEPAHAQRLYHYALEHARALHPVVACGRFGAEMTVDLSNHGPVTFWLEA